MPLKPRVVDSLLVHHFAYGSNLCWKRLTATNRAPSAKLVSVAAVSGYDFRFHKLSKSDSSGKMNIVKTDRAEDVVWGIVVDLTEADKATLNDREGVVTDVSRPGYREIPFTVTTEAGEEHVTFTYVATNSAIVESLRPYSWYKRYVITGARQQKLPADYVARLEAVETVEDPDAERSAKETLLAMRCA